MFQIENRSDATIVRVRCDIDFAVTAEFLQVLLLACNGGSVPLIVSLEECSYMDCSGLSVLIKVRNASRAPMSIVLRGGSFLRRLFAVAGLEKVLNVSDGFTAIVAA